MTNGRVFSTIKLHLAVISACHVGLKGVSAGQNPLKCGYMKGTPLIKPDLLAPPFPLDGGSDWIGQYFYGF